MSDAPRQSALLSGMPSSGSPRSVRPATAGLLLRRRGLKSVVAGAATGIVLLLVGCARDPRSQGPIAPEAPLPVPPRLVRIQIVAPEEMAPGESVQLTATAVMSDGSTMDVTNQATWSRIEPSILDVGATGLATGKAPGEVTVKALFASGGGFVRIMVIPKGTYRLRGFIRESGFGVEQVTITVTSGLGRGISTRSFSGGSYLLYGVAGPIELRLERAAFRTAVHELEVSEHLTRDLDISAERPRDDFRGTYTLTITGGSSCLATATGPLPEETKRRVYTANVEQDGPRLAVRLRNADFIVTNGRGDSFTGFVEATGKIHFFISAAYWDFYNYYIPGDFDIVERVGGSSVLVSGVATTTVTPAGLSGAMRGTIAVSSSSRPPFQPFAYCTSSSYQLELRR